MQRLALFVRMVTRERKILFSTAASFQNVQLTFYIEYNNKRGFSIYISKVYDGPHSLSLISLDFLHIHNNIFR